MDEGKIVKNRKREQEFYFPSGLFFATILLMALLVFGCTQPPSGNNGQNGSVKIQGNRFMPQAVVINAGESVAWTNLNGEDHTVTGFGVDKRLGPQESYSHTFMQAGTFEYVCTIHPGMTGTIIVR